MERNFPPFHKTVVAQWSAIIGGTLTSVGSAAYQGHTMFEIVKRWHPDYRLDTHVMFFVLLLLPLAALFRRRPLEARTEMAVVLSLVYMAMAMALFQAVLFMQA